MHARAAQIQVLVQQRQRAQSRPQVQRCTSKDNKLPDCDVARQYLFRMSLRMHSQEPPPLTSNLRRQE